MKRNRLKILVLAGGLSEERDVSLASAKAITESLIRLGHETHVIDAASGKSLLNHDGRYLYEKDKESSSKIALKQTSSIALTQSLHATEYRDIDLVFLALHGGAGEDGTIQALLELAGKKYTGSDLLASAVAMNKAFAKNLLRPENIPTPAWLLLKAPPDDRFESIISNIISKFKFPLIVKPNDSGSTVGLTLVKQESELPDAMAKAFGVSHEVLIEEYIKGREITAAVLDGQPLPLVEIIPTNELYDYQCKYTKGKSQYICPAVISDEITTKIQSLAVRACEVIGCSGLVRADFILDETNHPYFLEVNTLPGMTELSLAPMAAKEAGISFDQLVERICRTALGK
jgi:D-alanine-D-alanine ligase